MNLLRAILTFGALGRLCSHVRKLWHRTDFRLVASRNEPADRLFLRRCTRWTELLSFGIVLRVRRQDWGVASCRTNDVQLVMVLVVFIDWVASSGGCRWVERGACPALGGKFRIGLLDFISDTLLVAELF